ncbi:hypothetical protein [Pseudoduganella sp. R-34]|uniref:hypothetical protein n=1 Tax=Pseudoduganella sp. R-34 TaxID=3404062 RepID=UPI003CEAF896
MRLTKGDVVAWQVAAEITSTVAPEEMEFLPELVETVHDAPPAIGGKPGAFNGPEIGSAAIVIYQVTVEALRFACPKLFDAALDVGKDVLKRILLPGVRDSAPGSHASSAGTGAAPQVDIIQLRQLIVAAAKKNKLSDATSERIADAVAIHLLRTSEAASPAAR